MDSDAEIGEESDTPQEIVQYFSDDSQELNEFVQHDMEIDGGSNSDDVDLDLTFNRSLPSSHLYLGNVDTVEERTFLPPGYTVNIPLVFIPEVVLFPTQTLPMIVFASSYQHNVITAAMECCEEQSRLFGVIRTRSRAVFGDEVPEENLTSYFSCIGTTAEIRSKSVSENSINLIAKGCQRFRLVKAWICRSVIVGRAKILNDMSIPASLSLHGFQGNVSLSHLWNWQKRLYDPDHLRKVATTLLENFMLHDDAPSANAPPDPLLFSWWLCTNLPINNTTQQELLEINETSSRIIALIRLIKERSEICCSQCEVLFTTRNSIISMSEEGVLGTFVNRHGFIHEMITVASVSNISVIGRPSTQDSWFPGYAWSILGCSRCSAHIGWKFSLVHKKKVTNLSQGEPDDKTPQYFYGLRRAAIIFTTSSFLEDI